MVKRTLHFGNPAHLSMRNEQLRVELRDVDKTVKTIPIEDLGMVVLENPQITISATLLQRLMENKVAVITCDDRYMPSGMFLPLENHSEQTVRIRTQIDASKPLKKQLWQQTVKAKILNQASVLKALHLNSERLMKLHDQVLSGDSKNCEAQAASFYWGQLYGSQFTRTRGKDTPNAQLNYGYAILRSNVARALCASGMFPSVGIHHKNKYNAFCLADDIMEPYRPYVDWLVLNLPNLHENEEGLIKEQKIELLNLPTLDVEIAGLSRPLFHAVSHTTSSLYKCFSGEARKIAYPEFSP